MNSKECLERLLKHLNINEAELITKYGYSALNDIETIKQDLDRLEKLEKAIEILKKPVDSIEFITCDEEDCYGEVGLYQKINGSISIPLKTKEEYILVKEILNER